MTKKIYKGVKYFYDADQEAKLFNFEITYLGDKGTAFSYAKRYNGGIQVYQPKRDLKLFNVTND